MPAKSTPPEFLYFDLGNVLLTFSNERGCRQIAELFAAEYDRVTELVLGKSPQASLQWRLEAGELTDKEFFDHICEALQSTPERAAFDLAASDMFGPIHESTALVQRLNRLGHRLGILSNTNSIHWRFLTDGRYPHLLSEFELAVTSFEAQSMKPERRIYELAIERAGVPAERVFFVDDRIENVLGAVAAGIDAVQYTSHEQLVEDLNSRGIEVVG